MNPARIARLSLLAAVLLLLLLTAACTTTATEEPTAPTSAPEATEAPSDEVVELTMWDIVVSESFDQWWRDYIDEFNATHPNIQVTLETFESEAYKAKLSSAMIAGAAPEIFYSIPGPETAVWFDEGKLEPLDDLLDASRFVPAAREGCSDGDQLVCVPMYLAPSFMYYNTEQFAEAGIDPESWADPTRPTWDEFVDAVDALSAAGLVPIALGNADNWPGMFFYWAFQNRLGGLDGLNAAIDGSGSYTDESFIRAGELVQELTDMDAFPDGFNGIGGDQKYALFTQGNGAMIYQGPWMLGSISGTAPEGFEFGVFHFPTFADGDPGAQTDLMSGIDALWINANTPYKAEAAEFLKGFYDPENALAFMLETENIPSVEGTVEAALATGEEAPILTLAEASTTAANVFPWWDWALPPQITEEMLNMSQGLFFGEITPEDFGQRLEDLR